MLPSTKKLANWPTMENCRPSPKLLERKKEIRLQNPCYGLKPSSLRKYISTMTSSSSAEGDNMTATHKTDPHARGRPKTQRTHAPKEEATFDTELQRYVMPSERHVTMLKQGKG